MIPRLSLFVCLVLTLILPSQAWGDPETGNIEIFLGYLQADGDAIDEDLTYGLRFGHRFSYDFGLQLAVGRFDTDVVVPEPEFEGTPAEGEWTFLDVSAQWYFATGRYSDVLVFAGPGYAFSEVEFAADGPASDTLTFHGGAAWRYELNHSLYVRPDLRARWLEDSGDIDFEASIALGLTIRNK